MTFLVFNQVNLVLLYKNIYKRRTILNNNNQRFTGGLDTTDFEIALQNRSIFVTFTNSSNIVPKNLVTNYLLIIINGCFNGLLM